MKNKNRRLLKYMSDVFINPTKSLALVLHPPMFIVTACILFAIVESVHCLSHMKGAWDKYQSNQKTRRWMIAKNATLACRLIASLTAATALLFATLFVSYTLSIIGVPVYALAFMAASVFSTLHKIRGLVGHQRHIKAIGVTTEADTKKTRGLVLRAVVGVLGTGLTIAVLLKVAVVVFLIVNPYTFAVGAILFTAMAIWKAHLAYQEYHHPKHPELTSRSKVCAATPERNAVAPEVHHALFPKPTDEPVEPYSPDSEVTTALTQKQQISGSR